jgi:exodeoxyribonuclease VII large subunit
VVAQMAQRSDEAAGRLAEAARTMLRTNRRRWESPNAFLKHFDLKGRQERARLNWTRQSFSLGHDMHHLLISKRNRLETLVGRLDNLSPRRVLDRGYAIVFDEGGRVLSDAASSNLGAQVTAQLARGKLQARVEKLLPEKE